MVNVSPGARIIKGSIYPSLSAQSLKQFYLWIVYCHHAHRNTPLVTSSYLQCFGIFRPSRNQLKSSNSYFLQAFSWMSLESTASGSQKNPNLRCWNLGVLLKLRPNNLIQVDGVVKDVKPPTSHHPVLQFWYWIDMYILYIMCILCVYIYIYILCISKYLIQSVLDFKDKIMFPWFSNE